MSKKLAAIRSALSVLVQPGTVHELRIPKAGRQQTVSGYFDDLDAMAAAAAEWDGKAPGIYLTPNPCKPALLARRANRLETHAKTTTSDLDIERRRWLPIDADPVRPADISSSNEEHEAAIQRIREIRAYLARRGWPDPVAANSGNGGHLLYSIDLPNDADSLDLVTRCLRALAFRFSDEVVSVDTTVGNPARIWKLYGTKACKGDDLPERPHRMSRVLYTPKELKLVSPRQLQDLADTAPGPDPRRRSNGGPTSFNLERWIGGHADRIHVARAGDWQGGRKWILNPCPFDAEHADNSAFIVQFPSGAIAAGCHHNGCEGNDWHALRDLCEPGSRKRVKTASHETPPSQSETEPDDSEPLQLVPLGTLMQQPEEKTRWLVEDRLPEGGTSIQAGKPKAGKSTLARSLALSVARGSPWLGWPVTQGAVFYLALEDKRAEILRHFREMGASGDEPIQLLIGRAPEDAVAKLREAAEEEHPALIVIDTMLRFIRIRDLNDYAEVTRELDPILHIARDSGAHVLLLHHAKKGEIGWEGDAILGSTAILGTVDTAMILKRSARGRFLTTIQRYGSDLPETAVGLEEDSQVPLLQGTREELEENRAAEEIVEYLRSADEPKPEKEIGEETEGRTKFKRRALRALVEKGLVNRDGSGKRADPYRYSLAPNEAIPAGENSRFLVPHIYREQGNKKPESGLTPHPDKGKACSQTRDQVAGGREQESAYEEGIA